MANCNSASKKQSHLGHGSTKKQSHLGHGIESISSDSASLRSICCSWHRVNVVQETNPLRSWQTVIARPRNKATWGMALLPRYKAPCVMANCNSASKKQSHLGHGSTKKQSHLGHGIESISSDSASLRSICCSWHRVNVVQETNPLRSWQTVLARPRNKATWGMALLPSPLCHGKL